MELPNIVQATNEVSTKELTILKAKDLAAVLEAGALDYVRLLRCHQDKHLGSETIIFSIEVERSQKVIHDIRKCEDIAVVFGKDDKFLPEILALRIDFPRVPHTNLTGFEYPKSLCLFDQPYAEIKRNWTAARLIKRIHYWLSETSRGKLHDKDQPLEPLFLDPKDKIIISYDLVENPEATELLRISFVVNHGAHTFITEKNQPGPKDNFIVTIIKCSPKEHGVISKTPETLKELHSFCIREQTDLIGVLRSRLRQWNDEKKIEGLLEKRLLIVAVFPKTRQQGTPIEATDVYGFLCLETIKDVGEAIDAWQIVKGVPGHVISPQKNGENVRISLCKTIFALSPGFAATLNGGELNEEKVVMVGVGSLGSQIFMNFVRAGFGKWDLIDDDVLLPHNLARHTLNHYDVGSYKVVRLAQDANSMLGQKVVENVIPDNLINPVREKDNIEKSLASASVILDCSASIAASRYIGTRSDIHNRAISCFLNPSGDAIIILAEDRRREITLDILEMQYYRFLITKPELKDHLKQHGGRLRYSNTCRDVSSAVKQDLIAVAAGIGSNSLKSILKEENSVASIWQINPADTTVIKYGFTPVKSRRCKIGEWTLVTDELFLDKVQRFRAERLPNETGGVLIGNFDLDKKIVYVMDTVLSPPDSKEWPTTYIRGYEGLKSRVEEIKAITWENFDYIGEWHSHPKGHGCEPSGDDKTAFKWLNELMWAEGLPAIMLIVGEGDRWAFYLDRM